MCNAVRHVTGGEETWGPRLRREGGESAVSRTTAVGKKRARAVSDSPTELPRAQADDLSRDACDGCQAVFVVLVIATHLAQWALAGVWLAGSALTLPALMGVPLSLMQCESCAIRAANGSRAPPANQLSLLPNPTVSVFSCSSRGIYQSRYQRVRRFTSRMSFETPGRSRLAPLDRW